MRRLFLMSAVVLIVALGGLPVIARGQADRGVATLTGEFAITNPSLLEYLAVETSVMLYDMVAFLARDLEYQVPRDSQVAVPVEGDIAQQASYVLPLPVAPRGELNNVANGQGVQGVQIFAVSFSTNIFGDSFEGEYEAGGWPTSNVSVRCEPGTGEVIGGQLVVWAADEYEFFPVDFGPDGRLFTGDERPAAIGAGWTVVNLDQTPFDFVRSAVADVPLLEGDTGATDLSMLSYTEAFDRLIADLRVRYALNEFNAIDYDRLIATYRPVVEQAEARGNEMQYRTALFELAAEFGDGHVSSTPPDDFIFTFLGGVGLTLEETDNGEIIAVQVEPGSPADRAGIARGAAIAAWNDVPIADAIVDARQPLNHSSDVMRRYYQVRFLGRSTVNAEVRIGFRNPGQSVAQSADLQALQDARGLLATLPHTDSSLRMPIEVEVLPNGLGYINISTFIENPQLMVQTWEWAIEALNDREVPALVIDVRENGGGFGILPTYFAGSFFDEPFALYERYLSTADGKFVFQGRIMVRPIAAQWDRPVAVLIGPNCASACEIFVAAVAVSEQAIVVGSYPTFGVAAGSYGPWLMPDGNEFNAPVILPRTPDGTVFIEGTGVLPTIDVPVTVESLLSDIDEVFDTAVRELLARAESPVGQ